VLAGAAAGLAALVYFVGATTTWIRLKAAQLPADVVIAHSDRTQLIAAGVRAILALAFITAALAVAVYLLAPLALRRRGGDARLSEVAQERLLNPWSRRARIVATVAAITVLSFTNWQWFGLGVAIVIALFAFRRYVSQRQSPQPHGQSKKRSSSALPSLTTTVALVIATAIAAIALQLDEAFPVPTVEVDPPVYPEHPDVDIPYFGESGDFVYLADLYEITVRADGGYAWRYRTGVKELRRDDVVLLHQTRPSCLRPNLKAPAVAIYDVVRGKGPLFESDYYQPSPAERPPVRC